MRQTHAALLKKREHLDLLFNKTTEKVICYSKLDTNIKPPSPSHSALQAKLKRDCYICLMTKITWPKDTEKLSYFSPIFSYYLKKSFSVCTKWNKDHKSKINIDFIKHIFKTNYFNNSQLHAHKLLEYTKSSNRKLS